MKILMVYGIGVKSTGPKSVILDVAREIIKLNHEVAIYTMENYSEEVDVMCKNNKLAYHWAAKQIGKLPVMDNKLLNDWDVIHFHGVFDYRIWVTALSAISRKIPVIFSVHGNLMQGSLERSKYRKTLALNLIVKWILSKTTIIHSLADNESGAIGSFVNDQSKIHIIPNGINKSTPPTKIVNPFEGNKVLFLGRLDLYHKGLDVVFQTIVEHSEYYKQHGITFEFIGYFNTKTDKAYVENLLAAYPELAEIIKLHGEIKEQEKKEAIMKGARMFLHPSRTEGMPMAVLEALSTGLPCIITEETNMADIIANDPYSIVCESSTASIHAAVCKLVETTDEELKINALHTSKWVEENLSWKKLGKEYISMYQKAWDLENQNETKPVRGF